MCFAEAVIRFLVASTERRLHTAGPGPEGLSVHLAWAHRYVLVIVFMSHLLQLCGAARKRRRWSCTAARCGRPNPNDVELVDNEMERDRWVSGGATQRDPVSCFKRSCSLGQLFDVCVLLGQCCFPFGDGLIKSLFWPVFMAFVCS